MDTKRLISATVLYGLADVIVVAIGGFLLLPLYTRTLTQAEFGTYVIVRANTEIFTYILYFGMPSAVARVYFDYRDRGEEASYLSSVLLFFVVTLLVSGCLLMLWGDELWHALSPTTPVLPYLWFSYSIAGAGFFAALGSILLRLNGRVRAFASLQIATAVVLVAGAIFSLVVLKAGLPGLLSALLVSSACSAAVLPWLLGRGFRPVFRICHITDSLRYAAPILVGYVAYFVLNRVSTLVLQRHVEAPDIALFGLAQQLAMIITIVATAFGKALQPAVFSAPPERVQELLARSGTVLMRVMFFLAAMVVLVAPELLRVVAPKTFDQSLPLLLFLLIASFAYSFTLISDTALLYYRHPMLSAGITIASALISAGLAVLFIPRYHLLGATLAVAGAFVSMAFISHQVARRFGCHSYLRPMVVTLLLLAAIAGATYGLAPNGKDDLISFGVRLAIAALVFADSYRALRKIEVNSSSHTLASTGSS